MKIQLHRYVCIVCSVAVVLSVSIVSGATARYITSSKRLANSFSCAEYDTPIVNDTVLTDVDGLPFKSDITVLVGEHSYPVYVRVTLVVTWQDENGNVYWQTPQLNEDYTIEYDSTNWVQDSNGYYYYRQAVASGSETLPLITEEQKLKQIQYAPTGYTMHVEVITETIQAIGVTDYDSTSAIMDAWNVHIDGIP